MNKDYNTILQYLSGNLSDKEQEQISKRLDNDSAFLELYSKVQIARELLREELAKDEINQNCCSIINKMWFNFAKSFYFLDFS